MNMTFGWRKIFSHTKFREETNIIIFLFFFLFFLFFDNVLSILEGFYVRNFIIFIVTYCEKRLMLCSVKVVSVEIQRQ